MVRSSLLLATAAAVAISNIRVATALFSVHDDILAFPQFQVSIIMDSYYTEEEAAQILAPTPKPSTAGAEPELNSGTDSDSSSTSSSSSNAVNGVDEPREIYETMFWDSHKYLCSIPIVKPPPVMNATEKELHRAKEEKELARATTRGWELLSEMDGKCLYFISGWWSYSFCYNREIKQFHQLPAQNGMPVMPPKEDPATASYVLGRVGGDGDGRGGAKKGAATGEGTELQGSGEVRYLVQKMGGGTICDITGKERRIEVQYHCNPSSTDRIGFVKEVSICCYLMVVYTPRLCKDVAFLPPREGQANQVQCKEVMNEKQIAEWKVKRAKEETLKKLVGDFEKVVQDGKGVKGIGGGSKTGTGEKTKGKGDSKGSSGEKDGGKKAEKKVKLKGMNDEEYVFVLPDDVELPEDLEFLVAHDEL